MPDTGDLGLPYIHTTLPGPKSSLLIQEYDRCLGARTRPRMVVEKAHGCIVEDVDGNRFLVLSESVHVTGYSTCEIMTASIDQIRRIVTHVHRPSASSLEFAKLLLSRLPGELSRGRVTYCVSGTEAVTLAVSLAREYTNRNVVLSYQDSHHGYIGEPFQLSGDPRIKKNWTARISDIVHIPYPTCYRCPFKREYPNCDLLCLAYLENIFETVVFPDQIAGLIIEPILVNGGFYIPPEEYVTGIVDICQRNEIQLIIDEVYTGLTKTGRFLASQYWGITPDILCLGKAIGGGLPLSAVVAKRRIADSIQWRGGSSATLAGSSVACAAGIAVMEYVEKHRLDENAKKVGNVLIKAFRDLSQRKTMIGDVRGRGLLIGIDLVKDKKTKKPAGEDVANIVRKALDKGFIIGTAGRYRNVLRMTPPLTLTTEQAEKAVTMLDVLIS